MSNSGTSSHTQTLPACLRSTSTSCRRMGSPSALATSAIRAACSRSTSGWTTGWQHGSPAARFCFGTSSRSTGIDTYLSIEVMFVNRYAAARGPVGIYLDWGDDEPCRRGVQPPPAPSPRRDGPPLRRAARHSGPRATRARLRGALHPDLRRHLRRDAPPLPPAPPRRARDVPAVPDRPQRDRRLLRRRLHQPRDLQPHVPCHRRRDADRVPRARRGQARAQLLHDGVDAAEQFWRSQRAARGLASAPCSPSPIHPSSSSTRTRRWTSTSASSAWRSTPTSTWASCAG